MNNTGKNDPCPCGSGKKYKKCCFGKKPREHTIMIASSERLRDVHYNKETMEFTGLTHDNRLIKPVMTYSQTHYESEAGKERVISRIQDKVIPNEPELLRHLSSDFNLIIAIDTNTKIIAGERISAAGILHCVVRPFSEPGSAGYYVSFPWQGTRLFRNCPIALSPEKFAWITEIRKYINGKHPNDLKKIAIVTDHDMDNHASLNGKKVSIYKNFYVPENFTLLYGRGDGANDSLLNNLVKKCDKEASTILDIIERKGYFQQGELKYSIEHIPIVLM